MSGFFDKIKKRIKTSENELAEQLRSPGESLEDAKKKLEMVQSAASMGGVLKKAFPRKVPLKASYLNDPPVTDVTRKVKLIEDSPNMVKDILEESTNVSKKMQSAPTVKRTPVGKDNSSIARHYKAMGGDKSDPMSKAAKVAAKDPIFSPRQTYKPDAMPAPKYETSMSVAEEERLFKNLLKRFK